MNRGFKTYFSQSLHLSFYAIKKSSLRTKFSLFTYMIFSLAFRWIFFTRPLIALADENMSEMIIRTRNISFEKMFQGLTKKRYVDSLVAYLIGDLLAATAFTIFAVAPCTMLMTLCPSAVSTILHFVFALLGIFIFINIAINEYPVSYIASKTTDLDVSDYLYNSKTLDKKSKVIVFLNNLIFGTISFALAWLISFVIRTVPSIEALALREIVIIAAFAIFVLVYYFFVFRLQVSWRVSNRLLFSDVVSIKKQVVVKPLNGQGLKYGPLFVDDDPEIITSVEGEK